MSDSSLPFNEYGEYHLEPYFYAQYGVVPSRAALHLSQDQTRENMTEVLACIEQEYLGLEVVNKTWKIAVNDEDEEEEDPYDYPHTYLYRSATSRLCLLVQLRYENLYIAAYYDHAEAGLEKRVIAQLDYVRRTIEEKFVPTFHVLTVNGGCFGTRKLKVSPIALDIDKLYNDDFAAVDAAIQTSIEEKRSGIILLHGKPGTGKTTYIKSLLGQHAATKFIFIPNDFVKELLQPDFISFLINQKETVLVIEDAERVITSRENLSDNSVVSTILQLSDGLFSDYLKIKIICTFNTDRSRIDKALFRRGRMIAFYEFEELSPEKTNRLLLENGQEPVSRGLVLSDIYNYREQAYGEARMSIGFRK